jgi:16S rRNA (cytidine1402-2'-O)-methyltransferase
MMKPELYMIPVGISGQPVSSSLHTVPSELLGKLKVIFAENLRSARRAMRSYGYKGGLDHQYWVEIDRELSPGQLLEALHKITPDEPGGVLSEAGMPGIADPGSDIAAMAHQLGIRVIPLPGSSSIFLALAASGLNGQQFVFHGYLPVQRHDRLKKLKEVEFQVLHNGYTQIFMETPYRNKAMLESILQWVHEDIRLCIAADITGEKEFIQTKSIGEWKRVNPEIQKVPALFLLNR